MHQITSDSKYLIQHKDLQRVPQDFYRRNKDENVHQPLCIDYPNVTSGIRELSAKTYIKSINRHPIVTTGIPRKTYIKCSQIHNSIQSNNSETSKVKLNSSQEGRGGETPYDSTIVTKLVVHQDRITSRTRERERSNT